VKCSGKLELQEPTARLLPLRSHCQCITAKHSCHFFLHRFVTIKNVGCCNCAGAAAFTHPLQLQHSHLVHEVLPPLLQALHVSVLIQILHHAL
jgi:hypothetical protein